MSKEILIVVESLSHEKGVPKEVIFDALESALATATKKRYQEDAEFRVAIDRESGSYETFRRWEVIDPDRELEEDEMPNPDAELTPEEARERNPALGIGDFHEIPVESVEFGRIAAQAARQVLTQKVREAERAQVLEKYLPRVSQLVSGTVKKVTRDAVIVDLGGNAEAILMRGSMIPRETFRMGDRLRALLVDVRPEARGPQLILSRTTSEMLIELFKVEVPEIAEDVIEIRAAARNPGSRAKIAVYTNDGRIDPVGACVGMRGSRVQAVSGELAGERVDIVPWNENPAQLAINAMQPAEVASIVLDEDTHAMDIAVAEDNLAQAIGQRGENVRLASQLTGWELNIMTEDDAARQQEEEALSVMGEFMEALSVDENVAAVLAEEGFTTVEEVAYVPIEELRGIEGFDEEIVEELRQRAKDALLTKAIATGGLLAEGEPAPDLLNMEGMDRDLAYTLAGNGVVTMEDLAELATPDLLDIDEGIGEERASELIMTARAPWFEDEGEEEPGDVAEAPGAGTDEGALAAAPVRTEAPAGEAAPTSGAGEGTRST
ncbi:MAG: transcription termination/antitermination protein NusA [Gammaproteobacteria bacterium]|nr:transcription termination/antitermination protein NusA [Gammaproteobacteria bacterium]MYE83633.1 transcription termination/antitermination protein NusA [Gammaproteobacteria bacterium]